MSIGSQEVGIQPPFPDLIREKFELSKVTWSDCESYGLYVYNGHYFASIDVIVNTFKVMLPSHSDIFTRRRVNKFKLTWEPYSFETVCDRNKMNSDGTELKKIAKHIKKGTL